MGRIVSPPLRKVRKPQPERSTDHVIGTICGDASDPVKRELEEQRAKKAANGRELKSRSLWIADRESNGAAPETLDTLKTLRKQLPV